jgi:hypothetical protein
MWVSRILGQVEVVYIDMLTVNRDSAIPGFGIPRIRGSLRGGYKEAQAEFRWTIIGAAVGERGT